MATVLRIGPADHGPPMTLDEFMAGDYEEGYHYELIDGKLYVSPRHEAPQGILEHWIYLALSFYGQEHPEVVNYVTPKARVFVPGRSAVTAPEPGVATYHDFPLGQSI